MPTLTVTEYEVGDKEILIEYMEERGFERPIDVWLDNSKAMLDINMDLGHEWRRN